ncbi:IclR family transcriptional regulator [Mumia sp. Pv 4-285]|uniref:IclR family transcriptional regulator n=1 Tax=Mumia qirimensis TaxID=3234852 RepID=UPI00351CFE7C
MSEVDGRDGDAFARVRAVDRAMEVLEFLAVRERPATLSELSRELGVPKSTLAGILRTLAARGWLQEGQGGFTIGPRSLAVGSAYVSGDRVVAQSAPLLDALLERLGETVHLACLDGHDVLYLAKRESAHPLRMFSAIGRRLPAHATALGKAMLAELSETDVEAVADGSLRALTENTITSPDRLRDEIAETRGRGYAVDRGENADGIWCFAVALPVGDAGSHAISVSIPLLRLTPELEQRAVTELVEARRRFGRR